MTGLRALLARGLYAAAVLLPVGCPSVHLHDRWPVACIKIAGHRGLHGAVIAGRWHTWI